MLAVLDLKTRSVIANTGFEGIGIMARKMDDGTWVKTIVLIKPMRFEMEADRRCETDAARLEKKKRFPS